MKTTEDGDILKPCPFCGAEAKDAIVFSESRSAGENGNDVWLYAVIYCTDKKCGVSRSVRFKACPNNFEAFDQARYEVIQLWNTRVTEI